MYHSINFNRQWDKEGDENSSKNTWGDFHLIATSRPLIVPPTVKKKIIEIPGANGSLDLSTCLTGYPLYNNREGSFEFIVDNGHEPWNVLYTKLMEYFDGSYFTSIVLEDDNRFYYKGTCKLDDWVSNADGTWSNVTISYNLEPYKFSRYPYILMLGTISNYGQTEIGYDIGYAPTTLTGTVSNSDSGMKLILTYTDNFEEVTIERLFPNGPISLDDILLIPSYLTGKRIILRVEGYGDVVVKVRKGEM